jgi:hypothetical protein
MTIAEIRKIEEEREGSLGVIHLQKEGSFYHANDWSAWLMTKYPIGEAVNKPMTVTAKKLKDGYIHAFVGFPATSLAKYVPNDGSVEFKPVSDMQIDVTLNLDFGDASVEDVRSVNSYLGIFQHMTSYMLRKKLLVKKEVLRIGVFDKDYTKFIDRKLLLNCSYKNFSQTQ